MNVDKEEVINFIESKIGYRVSENTIFFDDLGIDDFESQLLMEEIANRYQIDMTNFDFEEYFFDKKLSKLLANAYYMLFNKEKVRRVNTFSLSTLLKSIERGKWDDLE